MRIQAQAALFTAKHEGGWYNGSNPRDPNPTMRGITQETYDAYRKRMALPRRTVQDVEDHEWELIAQSYWVEAKLDVLADLGLRFSAMTLFDHSFNAGPRAARKVLQRVLGVADDGIVGPLTLLAVQQLEQWEDYRFADRLNWERLKDYARIARSLRLRPNLLAWVNRVLDHQTTFLEGNL